jgi:hypothetical protein
MRQTGCRLFGSPLAHAGGDRGTGCVNCARPGLWGGRRVTGAFTRKATAASVRSCLASSESSFCPGARVTPGYCWPTLKYRNWYAQHAFFEGKKAESTSPRKSTLRTLKLGRLRARSFRPFLPAPRRTGQDTYRIIRLSGFLVSLTVAVYRSLG